MLRKRNKSDSSTRLSGDDKSRQSKEGRRRWTRRILWGIAILITICILLRVILWACLPWIIKKTMKEYDLHCTYEQLSVSLLTGDAELWHLELRPSENEELLAHVEYCRADVSMVTLLTSRLVVRRIEIDGMDVNVTRAADGTFPQFKNVQNILKAKKSREEITSTEIPAKPVSPSEIDLTPPFKMDALRLQHVQVNFRDESLSPAIESRLDMNVRLSDLGSEKRKTRFQVILSSPPVLNQLIVDGTGSSLGMDLLADMNIAINGLHPQWLKDYMAALGIYPEAKRVTFSCKGQIRTHGIESILEDEFSESEDKTTLTEGNDPQSVLKTLGAHVDLSNIVLSSDGLAHFVLKHIAIDANMPNFNTINFSKIELSEGRAHAHRKANKVLSIAGMNFVGRSKSDNVSAKHSQTITDSPATDERADFAGENISNFRWSTDNISLQDLQFILHDESVSPRTNLTFQIQSFVIEDAHSQELQYPGQLNMQGQLSIPGVVKTINLTGKVDHSSIQKAVTLKLSVGGIRPDALTPYLEMSGLESLYDNGEFTCDVNATFDTQQDNPFTGDISITDIKLKDTNELYGLKAISIQGIRSDPNSRTTHIGNVDISGQHLALGRDKTGYFNILGFRLTDRKIPQQDKKPNEIPRTDTNQDLIPKASEVAEVSLEDEEPRKSPTESDYGTVADKNDSPTSKIEIGRFSWHDNQVTFIDQAFSPAKSIIVPNFGFELKDLVLDFSGESASPGDLTAWLRVPGIIKQATLNGSVSTIQSGLSLDLELTSEGLTATEVAPYLQALGIKSAVTNGSLHAKLNTDFTWAQEGINCSVVVQDVAIEDSDLQLAGLKRLEVDKLQARNGNLIVDKIELDEPYLIVSREQTNVLNLAGINLLPRQKSKPKPEKESSSSSNVRISQFSLSDGRLRWSDHAVEPTVSQTLITNAELTDFALGTNTTPSTVNITLEAPGIIEKADLSGNIHLDSSEQGADLKLEVTGIQAEKLAPYFSTGPRLTLEDGSFSGQFTGKIKQRQEGGYQASLILSNLDYRDVAGQTPLLELDSAKALLTRFDPNAQIIAIEELSLHGLELVGERKTPDILSMLGFELQSKGSPADGTREPDDEIPDEAKSSTKKEQIADTSVTEQGRHSAKIERSRPNQLPLITLDTLDLQLEKFTLSDKTRPATSPIILSNLRIQNRQPIKLLGEDPDTNPVVNIDIMGKLQPFTESLTLRTELSPFTAQPRIQAELDVEKISGSGITSVVPELTNVVDTNGLSNGRFFCKAELMLSMDRRKVLDFDFGKPFGFDLLLKDIKFVDTDKDITLAGLEELHADIPRLDLTQKSIHVKEIGLTKPRGIVSRENDGLHILGLTFKTPAKEEREDTNSIEVSKGVNAEDIMIHYEDKVPSHVKKPDLRIDQILVNGIDFSFVDRTTNPFMHIPLTGLDVEVRDFSTQGTEKTKPIRFNAILTSGKVSLPRKNQEQAAISNNLKDVTPLQLGTESKESDVIGKHLLFQEMSATGRLSLYPKPDGWVKAGLSGLELVNFKGPANQVGMTLNDGILDASVDMRFRKEGTVYTRSQLVFTDLSLTEPPDGFLLQLLSLPTSLDTVLFILQDAGGAIRLPLAFKIDEDGLSRGQIVNAAIGATASLIANAVANSPFRIAGTVGDILGAEDKEKKAELETYIIQYDSGVIALSEEQFQEFERVLMRIQKDKNVTATIRHQLGGGDIKRADSLVNLSQKDSMKLLSQLKLDKKVLLITRDKLAFETQAAYAAGYHTEAWNKTKQLQKIERSLGLIERSLDDLLEMMRQGTEHIAKRRTRHACLAMGKARLDTLVDILASKDISAMHDRIKFFPPRFTETQGNQGGSISITLSTSKAR